MKNQFYRCRNFVHTTFITVLICYIEYLWPCIEFVRAFIPAETFNSHHRLFRSNTRATILPRQMSSDGETFSTTKPTTIPNVTKMIPQNQPSYQIAGVDLSKSWVELVCQEKVCATVMIPVYENNNQQDSTTVNEISVKYGIRMVKTVSSGKEGSSDVYNFEEYVIEEEKEGRLSNHPLITSINATLTRMQQQHQSRDESKIDVKEGADEGDQSSSGIAYKRVGDFVAQLQLVRTLRPPPSPGFSGATTSIPPSYNSETDSFVTGPLRLELRPLIAQLQHNNLRTAWDVYHNVSPADTRGHFLLLPTLSDKNRNWRGQIFTQEDCHDLVQLTSAIEPPGSLCMGYNSVGAGASQNHIHCHAWPCPPVPLLSEFNNSEVDNLGPIRGWNAYAVSKVESIYDYYDVETALPDGNGKVEISYLKYPVFCILLSASIDSLELLGKAVASCLDIIGEAPHNIAFLNRPGDGESTGQTSEGGEEIERFVDVYVFARSKERSESFPTLKLGISEMMGVFHAQSSEELTKLASGPVRTMQLSIKGAKCMHGDEASLMEQALVDVSIENEEVIWESIKSKLSTF